MAGFPHRLTLALAALAWIAVSLPAGPAAAGASAGAVEAAAADILQGLNDASLADVPAGGAYDKPTLAIRAVADDAPRATDARHANDLLLAALQRRAGGRVRFVANEAVPQLIDEIGATSGTADEHEARVRDLRANLRPDILVVGTVRNTPRGDSVVYKALAMDTGVLLASAAPVSLDAPRVTTVAARDGGLPDPAPTGYRQTVHEAERLLDELGYAPGPVDGRITAETRAALRAYQADSALPVNGRMTWAVVENMRR
ncbi:MAG: peptidoglycan-binding protein, partial [Alphaproteobacteria bacterium]|nr:peptidoglycan-binding protein [Alphaproteobacteria bacterium]